MPPEETKPETYNPRAVQEDLKVIGAYATHPMGEFIAKLGHYLELAQNEIVTAHRNAAAAIAARNKAEGELETARETIHRLRNGATGMAELIDTLKAISLNPKGAAKLAKETLAKVNGGAS